MTKVCIPKVTVTGQGQMESLFLKPNIHSLPIFSYHSVASVRYDPLSNIDEREGVSSLARIQLLQWILK